MVSPQKKNFPYNLQILGQNEIGESEVSAMQNQGNGQNMKSRNQNPAPQGDPQATQMENKKNQVKDKRNKNERA